MTDHAPMKLEKTLHLGQTKLISWFTDPAGLLFIECKIFLNLGVSSGGCGSQLNEWAW